MVPPGIEPGRKDFQSSALPTELWHLPMLFQLNTSIYLPKSSAIRLQDNFCTSLLLLFTVLRRSIKPPSYYSPLPTLTSFVFLLRKPYIFTMSKNSSLLVPSLPSRAGTMTGLGFGGYPTYI